MPEVPFVFQSPKPPPTLYVSNPSQTFPAAHAATELPPRPPSVPASDAPAAPLARPAPPVSACPLPPDAPPFADLPAAFDIPPAPLTPEPPWLAVPASACEPPALDVPAPLSLPSDSLQAPMADTQTIQQIPVVHAKVMRVTLTPGCTNSGLLQDRGSVRSVMAFDRCDDLVEIGGQIHRRIGLRRAQAGKALLVVANLELGELETAGGRDHDGARLLVNDSTPNQ